MNRLIPMALLLPALMSSAVVTHAAEPLPRRELGLDGARRVVAAAEAEARRQGWPCVVAVVDRGGYLIALERMDASPMLASTELAPAKARSAALFGKPTRELEDAARAGRVATVSAGFVIMTGGVPLRVGGEEVGAVGISSARPEWDEAIAEAAAAAL